MIESLREGVREILRDQKASMREVVNGVSEDALNWLPAGNEETNSIAQLLSHALEAERFLLATSVDATVDRDREAQFRLAGVTANNLLANIDQTEQIVNGFLDQLTEQHLAAEVGRPTALGIRSRTGSWWLLHAVEHSCEHLGQAYLTRQLFERQAS